MASMNDPNLAGVCQGFAILDGCDTIGKSQLTQLLSHMRNGCLPAAQASHDLCLKRLCIFLASRDNASRQVALSILQASVRKSSHGLLHILQNQLTAVIQAATIEDPASCQALLNTCFSLLENFPTGSECLNSHLPAVLTWLSECVKYCCSLVLCGNQTSASVVHKEICQNSLALVNLILQRLKKRHACFATALSCVPLDTSSEDCHSESSSQFSLIFSSLLKSCLAVLKSPDFSLESQTSASVLSVSVLRFANGMDNTSTILVNERLASLLQQVLCVFGQGSMKPAEWPVILYPWSSVEFSDLAASSQRSLLHALVNGLPKQCLISDISSPTPSKPVAVKSCILLDIILPAVLTICKRSDSSNMRVLSSRLLANITTDIRAMLGSTTLANSVAQLKPRLLWNGEVVSQLVEFICDNWDDPVDAFRHQINSVFDCLVGMHVVLHEDQADQGTLLIRATLQSLLSLSWHVRGKYPLLMSFAQHTPVASMLTMLPSLATDVLAMIGDMKLHSPASDLFNRLCGCHYRQLMAESSEQCSSSDVVLVQWQEIWLEPLLHCLCTGGSRLKTHLTEYCLPVLFQTVPNSLTYLSTSLLESLEKKGDEAGILSALLLCLHHVRKLSTRKKMAQAKTAGSGNSPLKEGWNQILRQALAHSDDEVRLNALALLCESRQTAEPVSEEYFNLLRFFLPYNLTSQDPSFRQRLASSMKKMLLRIQASCYAAVREVDRCLESCEMRGVSVKTAQLEQHQKYCSLCYDFLSWLTNLFISCIEPHASFQRCTAALHLLHVILEAFPKPVGLFSPRALLAEGRVVQTLLSNLLTDCYSSNQEMFVGFLAQLPPEALGFKNEEYLSSYIQRLCWLAASPRSEDCTTSQHLLLLLVKSYIEKHNVEVHLPDNPFTCPLASGQASTPPPLQVPVTDSSVDEVKGGCSVVEESQRKLKAIVVLSEAPLSVRLLQLWRQYLSCIQDRLNVVQSEGLLLSLSECSLYGLVLSLRSLLMQPTVNLHFQSLANDPHHAQQAVVFVSECVQACIQLAAAVQTVVCDDTPEGYCVDEVSDEALSANPDSAAKDFQSQLVVVCSWRCLKEAALLLAQLVVTCSVRGSSKCQLDIILMTAEQVQDIGAFFVKQLLTSRHLGAFEKVHTGFVTVCQQLWRFSGASLNQLPRVWVETLISELSASHLSTENAVSITRRSAGLPPYVQTIVVTEPPDQNYSCLRHVVQEMLRIANYPVEAGKTVDSSLCQVHAINILSALFRESQLGPHITSYVADTLILAIEGFAHSVWAVRNSCTHLFRVMISRIFGVNTGRPHQPKTNRMTGREFFSKFPCLYSRLRQLLEDAVLCADQQNVLEPRLFPLLLLLSHLIPSVSSSLEAFTPLVVRCAGVPVWQARVMAAESLVPLVAINDLATIVSKLMLAIPDTAKEPFSRNAVQGTLLQLKHLISYHIEQSASCAGGVALSELLPLLWERRWLVSSENCCSPLRSLAVDLFVKCTSSGVNITESATDALVNIRHFLLESARDCIDKHCHEVTAAPASASTLVSNDSVAHWQSLSILASVLVTGQSSETKPSDKGDKLVSNSDDVLASDRTLIKAVLMSDVYESQLAVLDYYSEMLKRRSEEEASAGPSVQHEDQAPDITDLWLKEILISLFLHHDLQSLCLEKVAEMLVFYVAHKSRKAQLGPTIAAMTARCEFLLSARGKSWNSFGHILLLLSHLLVAQCAKHKSWQQWLVYLRCACDDSLSWSLHIFAADSLRAVMSCECNLSGDVLLSAWSCTVMLLQDEQIDVRQAACSAVLQASVHSCVLSRVYHLQTSRFLLLALVVMAVQGHRYCHGSAVFHLLRTWSSLGSEQTKKTGHLAGQLFLKSDLNSFYESTFLAKESCKVLAKFGCDENDMADISKVQAFVRQEVLGDP